VQRPDSGASLHPNIRAVPLELLAQPLAALRILRLDGHDLPLDDPEWVVDAIARWHAARE